MMKKFLLLLIVPFFCFPVMKASDNSVLEIYYFHADQRCSSDLQIEKETKDVVKEVFSEELKTGRIVLNIVNFMDTTNQFLIDKFEIGWSSLIFNVKQGNNKYKIDMNEFAFTNVPADIMKFRSGLEQKIKNLLESD